MTPLAKTIRSGLTSQRSIRTTCRAAEAADHRVDDQQGAGALADLRDLLDVTVGRVDAAGADHGLHEERGHALGADGVDLRG